MQPPARDHVALPSLNSFRCRVFRKSNPALPVSASTYQLPSLDFSQQQASQQYWPGANTSTPATVAQALNTLPTPPSDGTEGGYRPPIADRGTAYSSLGAASLPEPGMGTNLDASGPTSSLSARRPAAINLPNFELPLPFGGQLAQKFSVSGGNTAQTTQGASVNVGNLLTPPSTVPGDSLSPITSALGASNNGQGLPSYNNFSWPPLSSGLTPLAGPTGITPQPWSNPLTTARGMFSPSLSGSVARGSTNTPTATEGLPPPPQYDFTSLPPFPSTTMSMSAPGSLPTIAAQQQQAMAQAYMAQNPTQGQTQTPISAATAQTSPINDLNSQKPQSTPAAYYAASQPTSAQQSTFPSFNNNSPPVQQSPMSAPPQTSRISPFNAQQASFPPPSQTNPFGGGRSFAPYPLPAVNTTGQVNGPVLSNIHSPNNPMGMMGLQSNGHPGSMMPPFHSGIAAQMQQQMYNPQQTPHNERPFKCDQCPQSFNRNHDLKRHKRIHLAVKPFPCGFCEKSFSRKDALKVRVNGIVSLIKSMTDFSHRGIFLLKGAAKGGHLPPPPEKGKIHPNLFRNQNQAKMIPPLFSAATHFD